MWQTPTANTGEHPGQVKWKKGQQLRLAQQVNNPKLWPTPSAQQAGDGDFIETLQTKDGEPAEPGQRAYNPKTGKHSQVTLNRAVKMWPTPTTQDSKNNGLKSQQERHMKPLNAEVRGALNPAWVEWLMGFPAGWTNLEEPRE